MTAMQTNLMQCAAYGLSTDRLTPHPFNLGSNAGSTHTSISQTQPLDMTLSRCTQLLWSTMARPFLSGICPVKLLYGLGHRAAAQFQGLANLLIAYARGLQPSTSKEPFWPLSYRIKFTWSHKIFDAQIKITRHIAKVLYSVMLQDRGIAIISEKKGTEMSNVVIIISIIIFMYI